MTYEVYQSDEFPETTAAIAHKVFQDQVYQSDEFPETTARVMLDRAAIEVYQSDEFPETTACPGAGPDHHKCTKATSSPKLQQLLACCNPLFQCT